MSALKSANLVLRFLLELCALAALGYWGLRTGRGLIAQIGLGIGAPLLAAVAWGLLVAPRAPVATPAAVRLLVELAVFGAAVAGLVQVGRPALAWALGAVFVLHRVLKAIWRQ